MAGVTAAIADLERYTHELLQSVPSSIARGLGKPLIAEHIPAAWLEAHSQLWSGKKRNFGFAANWVRYESAFDVTALRDAGFKCRTDHDLGVTKTIAWLDERGMITGSSDDDLEDVVVRERRSEQHT